MDERETLIIDLRAYVLATRSLVAIEATNHPERRTEHLVARADALIRRIDAMGPAR